MQCWYSHTAYGWDIIGNSSLPYTQNPIYGGHAGNIIAISAKIWCCKRTGDWVTVTKMLLKIVFCSFRLYDIRWRMLLSSFYLSSKDPFCSAIYGLQSILRTQSCALPRLECRHQIPNSRNHTCEQPKQPSAVRVELLSLLLEYNSI